MANNKAALQARSWTKEQYLISTQTSLIPIPRLIDVFNSKDFYWAKATPEQSMREMVDNSLSFGMYERMHAADSTDQLQGSKFIGLARCVTDYITFAYLTDVWVDPAYQGRGLGSWLIQCVQEVLETMPHLRRTMLCTADWERSVPFYERLMGMQLMKSHEGDGLAVMEAKGKGHPSYGREGTSYDR